MSLRASLILFSLLAILLAACGGTPTATLPSPSQTDVAKPAATEAPSTAVPPTATPAPPSPTPEPPAAARVNGQPILLETYQKELARYEAAQHALGRDPAADGTPYQTTVLDALIEQVLVEQAAAQAGITVSDEALDAEFERLIQATGGGQPFVDWLEMNQYTEDEFREVLRSQMITQAMIERVTAAVADSTEQVNARHIVVDSMETGEWILAQLEQGTDFATLAIEYSLDESTRMNGGDLGFFPRGLLLAPEVEQAAFALEPGQISSLVESGFGIHIIQVLEKDPSRATTPEVLQRLRTVAFEQWLDNLWVSATVERNI